MLSSATVAAVATKGPLAGHDDGRQDRGQRVAEGTDRAGSGESGGSNKAGGLSESSGSRGPRGPGGLLPHASIGALNGAGHAFRNVAFQEAVLTNLAALER